jgi:hypothetical protein
LSVSAEGKELFDQSFVFDRVAAQSEIGASETGVVLDLVVPRLNGLLATSYNTRKGYGTYESVRVWKLCNPNPRVSRGVMDPRTAAPATCISPKSLYRKSE